MLKIWHSSPATCHERAMRPKGSLGERLRPPQPAPRCAWQEPAFWQVSRRPEITAVKSNWQNLSKFTLASLNSPPWRSCQRAGCQRQCRKRLWDCPWWLSWCGSARKSTWGGTEHLSFLGATATLAYSLPRAEEYRPVHLFIFLKTWADKIEFLLMYVLEWGRRCYSWSNFTMSTDLWTNMDFQPNYFSWRNGSAHVVVWKIP